MTENTPEPEAPEAPEARSPKDAPDDVAKGYAVYDTQLQRYVTGVYSLDAKPSRATAAKLAPNGHRIVKV